MQSSEALIKQGLDAFASGVYPEAEAFLHQALKLDPSSAEGWFNLGVLCLRTLRSRDAEVFFARAISLVKDSAATLVSVGQSLKSHGQLKGALERAENAIVIEPESVAAHVLAAGVLNQLGRVEEGRAHSERAVALDSTDPKARMVLATVLLSLGQVDEARGEALEALALDPKLVEAYSLIAFTSKPDQVDINFVLMMESMAKEWKNPAEAEMLHFAIARCYETIGRYENAMQHYDEANRIARQIKFGNAPLNKKMRRAHNEFMRALFSPQLLDKCEEIGSSSEKPILIVGMPRSGTTLMEHILSCHPDVAAAGEVPFWIENSARALDSAARSIKGSVFATLASEYLAELKGRGGEGSRITDKMPGNAMFLGFIRLAFPNSRVIHMSRNGADTCFSIYTTPNAAYLDFLHDKEAIAFEYEMHQELMGYWRGVFPADWLLDVSYEELVSDQERTTKKVLEFCGLEWSDACLAPENNKRPVATPSLWQVRQPIYRSSVARWKNFEPWLEAFKKFA